MVSCFDFLLAFFFLPTIFLSLHTKHNATMQDNLIKNHERDLDSTIGKFLKRPVVKNLKTIQALRYGDMDIVSERHTLKHNIFTEKFELFSKYPYPQVYDTYHEVEGLKKLQRQVMDNPNFKANNKFFKDSDRDIHAVFEREFRKIGVKYNGEYLEGIQDKLGGLTMQLKKFYNRPRPYQFSFYSKQHFNPFPTMSGHSPAYPSGHALQSYFLMEVMAHKNPSKAKQLRQLGQRIADTRIAMGVHYPSDNEFGKKIGKALKGMKDIRNLYFK